MGIPIVQAQQVEQGGGQGGRTNAGESIYQTRFVERRKVAVASERKFTLVVYPVKAQPVEVLRVGERIHRIAAERPVLESGGDVKASDDEEESDEKGGAAEQDYDFTAV